MPAGTWNLPDIQKTVPYKGIKDISTIQIFDTTPTSDNYFNVLDFPDRLTSGKNLFKINAANNNSFSVVFILSIYFITFIGCFLLCDYLTVDLPKGIISNNHKTITTT